VLATLTMFSAETIARAIKAALPGENDPFRIYLSGGGIHNPLLIRHLETHFNGRLASTADLGIDPDAKEAVLFALLANEAVGGGRINYGDRLHLPSISMGKVSFPE
jgi:anhydro-N-acetylmuramic acid kinase